MKLIRQLSDFPNSLRGCAVAIGNFDGVHRGHGVLIDQLKSFASELDGAAVVFTFDPHPVRILRPEETPPPLTWTDRKLICWQNLVSMPWWLIRPIKNC